MPLLDWASNYRREWLASDLVAGLTTAAVVIPKALAYATVAGLPIQVGLYTAFVPLIIYAVLGSSRLSVTTSATLAILTAAEPGHVTSKGDTVAMLHAATLLTLMVDSSTRRYVYRLILGPKHSSRTSSSESAARPRRPVDDLALGR